MSRTRRAALIGASLIALAGTGVAARAGAPLAAAQAAERGAEFDEVWQTVNDAYYDPSFGGLDWPAVKAELRPKALAAKTAAGERAVINEMLGRLKQSHFALLSASAADADVVPGGPASLDIEIRPFQDRVVITRVAPGSNAARAGLAPGQLIIGVDGPIVPGSSPLVTWRRVNARLHGPEGSTAAVQVVLPPPADGSPRTINVARTLESGPSVQFSNLPDLHVNVDARALQTPGGRRAGVVAFNIWLAQADQPIAAAVDRFREADGLIFDLRGNPGGLAAMIMGVAGHVIDRPAVLGTMRTRQVPQLKFVVNPRRSTADGRAVTPYAGPVAIIVDELTASASECFAGALQDLGRARIFGRRSMGQALPASTRRLANGDVLEYVVGDFVTSKGRSLEGPGVTPDEVQPLTVASLASGADAPVDAALNWIDRQPRAGGR